jgi:hypothetical protein
MSPLNQKSLIEYLAHVAFRTFYAWLPPPEECVKCERVEDAKLAQEGHFDQLSDPTKEAWRQAAHAVWNELYMNARPPRLQQKDRTSGTMSAFELLHNGEADDAKAKKKP